MIPEQSLRYFKHKLQKIPSRLQGLSYRLQTTLRKRGVRNTLHVCISKVNESIRGWTAARRRAKYWEREFDRKHGVKTEYLISLHDLDVRDKAEFRIGYQATPPSVLQTILKGLNIPYDDFVFIDYGSGLGRALLVASEFPFKKIIGVEFSSELHRAAQQNVRNFRSANQKCPHIELMCMDALDYPVPAENTVFYLYNPFQGPVMQRVLDNIGRSLEESPRKILIAYFNSHHELLEIAPFLEKVRSGYEANNSFAIYRNKEHRKPGCGGVAARQRR